MRGLLLLLLAVPLAGCHPAASPVVAVAAVEVGSIAVFHRDVVDLVFSLVSGRDCSIVRLEQGLSYCKPQEAPPAAPPYCTRSLGVVDCWSNPSAVPNLPREVADGPRTLTPAQERDRTARWPNL